MIQKIKIGTIIHYYQYTKYYTLLFNENHEEIVQLTWKASKGEVRAAFCGYYAGLQAGEEISEQQESLKKILNITLETSPRRGKK